MLVANGESMRAHVIQPKIALASLLVLLGCGGAATPEAYPPPHLDQTVAPDQPNQPFDLKATCAAATAVPVGAIAASNGRHSPRSTKDKPYSLGDLQARNRAGDWESVFEHLEDIPQTLRKEEWTSAMETAATSCLKSTGGQRCIDEMLYLSDLVPSEVPTFGTIVVENANHYEAMPFFVRYMATKKEAADCSGKSLKLAVVAALSLSPDDTRAAGARSIAANGCFAKLKDAMIDHLSRDRGAYTRDNTCSVLRANGGI